VVPDAAARLGRAAEAAGFESLWVADHVVLPDPPVAGRPMAPDQRLLDPIVALTFLAAHTSRIRLGTGVIILPQRQALVLAKQIASLDVLSNGRVIFGLGVGWCEPEMRAVGAPFAERGRVADDYLAAMRAVWTQPKPAYRGRYVSFDGVQAMPRPVQAPTPPIVVGGRTPPAFRRAVTQGHGWYGFGLDVAETQKLTAALREAGKKHARPAGLGALEISVTPPGFDVPDTATVDAYAAAGVHRLILRPRPEMDAPALERFAAGRARSPWPEAMAARFVPPSIRDPAAGRRSAAPGRGQHRRMIEAFTGSSRLLSPGRHGRGLPQVAAFSWASSGPPRYHERYGNPMMRRPRIHDHPGAREVWLACFERVLAEAPERYRFPAEHLPGFRAFLRDFSLWMVNTEEPAPPR
jgi:probable F420-dependent oxidoreductase